MKIVNSLAVPEVGDHLVGHYGYEASIAEAFIVKSVTKTMVAIQRVAMVSSDHSNGGMDWKSKANWDCPVGEVFKKKFVSYENGYSVKIASFLSVYPTDKNEWECYNYH